MTDDTRDRLDRLESLVEQQQETIEEQRERIAELEGDNRDGEGDANTKLLPPVSRRDTLTAGGLIALLFGGVGTASADAQGQVGTSNDPLNTLYTAELNGPVTGDQSLTTIDGSGLTINSGSLETSGEGTSKLETSGNGDTAFQVVDGTTDVSKAGSSIDSPNVVGGHPNNNTGSNSPRGATIAGGGTQNNPNVVSGITSIVGGGRGNTASGLESTVPGGRENTASGDRSTIAGGIHNTASGTESTVGGGVENRTSGRTSTVPGGKSGAATNQESFVWNDGSAYHSIPNTLGDGLNSATAVDGEPVTGSNTFSASASSGFRFITGSRNVTYIDSSGNLVSAGNVDARGGIVENSTGSLTVTHGDGNADHLTLDAGSSQQAIRIDNLPEADDNVNDQQLAIDTDNNNRLVRSSTNTFSSARYKQNIQPLDTESGAILDVEPRSFEYIKSGTEDIGVIAEQVDEYLPDLVTYDDEGRPNAVKYDRLGVYLIPEVRQNRDSIETHDASIAEQQASIECLESTLEDHEETIAGLEADLGAKDERIDDLEAENEQLRERLDAIEAHLGIDESAGQQAVADD